MYKAYVLPIFDDFSGHGTAIAGIIAGKNIKESSIVGINSNIELYSIKVMDGDNTAPLSRVIKGIYKALEYDVDISNMSFGTTVDSSALYQAIKEVSDKDILIIASAGNNGKDTGEVEYPAGYEEVLAVGSVDSNGEIAQSSSQGEQVDVWAPGEFVKTRAAFGLETVNSGTSIATPHVVGMASLIWQKDKNKSSDFVRGLIEDSAKVIKKNQRNIK